MDFSFLPVKYIPHLERLVNEGKEIWEIRIRENAPMVVRTNVGDERLTNSTTKRELTVEKGEIENVLLLISGQALYKISEAMCNGVVFTDSGVRIGICGRGVLTQGTIRSITEITSLCIRFPYPITHFAKNIIPYLRTADGALLSTLILSAPAGGKTTLLRDFASFFASMGKNVTLIDERLEFSSEELRNVDVIREIPKDKAVLMALRTLNPDIVICDEVFSAEEVNALSRATHGGVCVFASLHATSISSAFACFPNLNTVFSRFICLHKGVTRNFTVYDAKGQCLAEGKLCQELCLD